MKRELDCRGLMCPEPVIRCRDLIKAVNPHDIKILVDNSAALENVERFLSRNGYATESVSLPSSEWQILASKSKSSPCEKQGDTIPAPDFRKTLILLTTETIGRGDDELGAKLMDTFLTNLGELGDSLWRIILLNGAVKLSTRTGKALEALKSLEASGVSILVCGTCLNHYGLLDKRQVGETTNMMDVITSLSLAQKIIRP